MLMLMLVLVLGDVFLWQGRCEVWVRNGGKGSMKATHTLGEGEMRARAELPRHEYAMPCAWMIPCRGRCGRCCRCLLLLVLALSVQTSGGLLLGVVRAAFRRGQEAARLRRDLVRADQEGARFKGLLDTAINEKRKVAHRPGSMA